MKKTFCILSMMLLGGALHAGPVTPEKALQVAQRVFASAPGTKAAGESELKIVWDGEFEPATKGAQDPAFYVVSRPEGGFVMVSGDDNVQPILAFSFENDFIVEGMPDNVRWWMQQYKNHVRSSVSATPAVREQWEKYESTKASPVSPVDNEFTSSRTNEWNQTNPANFYCPNVTGQTQTSVCGCVALVTAEIMAWFGTRNPSLASIWPSGKQIPGYNYTSRNSQNVEVASHYLTITHDWEGLNALASASNFYNQIINFSGTTDQYYKGQGYNTLTTLGYDLALLTYDIGTLVQAEYNDSNNSGTGAATANVPRAVAPVFGYNNGARYVSKSSYTNGQWELLMKEQIYDHPIIYTGPGHAYAADGYGTYNNKLYFHFNMGWGGDDNGYYTLDIQEALENPHYAIIDFYPSDSYVAQPQLSLLKNTDKGGFSYQDMSSYNPATPSFYLKNIANTGSADFTGDIYVFVIKPDGSTHTDPILLKSNVSMPKVLGGNSFNTWGFTLSGVTATFGDQLVAHYKYGESAYIPFVFDPYDVNLPALPIFPAAAIKKKASYSVGEYFVFELTNNSYTYETSTWKITTPDGVTTSYNMDDYRVQLTTAGEYKISCTTPDQEKVVTYITVTAQ